MLRSAGPSGSWDAVGFGGIRWDAVTGRFIAVRSRRRRCGIVCGSVTSAHIS